MAAPLLPPGAGRAAVLAFALYCALALLVTWPFPAKLADSVPGGLADPLIYSAILNWDWQCLAAADWRGYFSAPFVHPYPSGLAYANHLTGLALAGLPLAWLGCGPLVAYGVLTLAAFPLAALAMFLLALACTHSRAGALLAGLVYAFAPFRLLRLGHVEVLHSWGLPLALLLLMALLTRPHWARAAALAAVCAWQGLTNLYFAVYLALLLPLALLCLLPTSPARGSLRLWLLLALAAALAAVIMLPSVLPYRQLQVDMGLERSLAEVVAPQNWSN